MKEKSAMGENFFDFAKTRDALSQMTTDLAVLESVLKEKAKNDESVRKDMENDLAEKEKQIEEMKKSIQKAADKIDNITKYIDGVL